MTLSVCDVGGVILCVTNYTTKFSNTVQKTLFIICQITVKNNGQNLERVKQFCYLGSLVTEDCRSCHDIRRWIALGKEAFNKKSDLMRGSLSLHLKKRMVKAFVWSVALYGSETWTLQKEDIRRLEAYEIWIWRRMMDWAQNKWRDTEDGWGRKKNNGHR